MKLKLFQDFDIDDLETKVNDWIDKKEGLNPNFAILDRLMSQGQDLDDDTAVTIAIWYEY